MKSNDAAMTRFFHFSPKAGHVAYCGNLQIPKPWSNFDLHRGRLRPLSPLVMTHNMGGPLRDVVETGWAIPVVVSQKFVHALAGSGCTGWSTFPVALYDKSGSPVTGFHGFQVVGECGQIDWRRSQPVPKEYPRGVFPMLKGMYFPEASWDGSDVFGPSDTGFTFMTERAGALLKRHAISNMDLEPIDDVVTDIWPGDMQSGWKHLRNRRWEELSPADLKPSG